MIKKFLSKYRWLRQIYISLLNLLDYVINLFKIIFSPINEIKFLRWIFFLALPRSRYFQIDIKEIKFFVNSSDKVISKKIFVSKKFPEFQHFEIVIDLLKNKERVVDELVDIGSHYGSISIPAMKKYNFNNIYAFEPNKNSFKTLNMNIALNDYEGKFKTFNKFVDKTKGDLEMLTFTNNTAASISDSSNDFVQTYIKSNNLNFSHKEIVTVDTLDSLLYSEKLSHPLFWLYCQGKEIDIISSSNLILENKFPVCFAYSPLLNFKKPKDIEDLTSLLRENDYKRLTDVLNKDEELDISLESFELLNNRYKFNGAHTFILID